MDKLIFRDHNNSEAVGEERRVLSEVVLRDVCANVQKIVSLQLEDRLRRAIKFLKLRNIQIGSVVVSGGGICEQGGICWI